MKLKVFTYGDDPRECFDLLVKEAEERYAKMNESQTYPASVCKFEIIKNEHKQYYMKCTLTKTITEDEMGGDEGSNPHGTYLITSHAKIKVVKNAGGADGGVWYNMSFVMRFA